MKFFITGRRRGLGKYLAERYETVESLDDADVFINCKHDGFSQVDLLKIAAASGKRVINIGSDAADEYCSNNSNWIYSVEKMALDAANEILYYQGYNTTIIRLGWIDSESVAGVDVKKIPLQDVKDIIDWVLKSPHRIKDITIAPKQ